MSEVKLMKVHEFPKHDKNPFTDRFAVSVMDNSHGRVIKYARKDGQVISPHGEVLSNGELILGREHIVDKQRFIKVYVESLMLFSDLSKRAIMLFAVLLQRLEKDKAVVYLVPQEIVRDMEISEPTYYRALSELLSAKVIARHSASSVIYFINPALMFNGDRMTLVNRYVMDQGLEESRDDSELKSLQKKNDDIEPDISFEE